jgi:hypothetical protein
MSDLNIASMRKWRVESLGIVWELVLVYLWFEVNIRMKWLIAPKYCYGIILNQYKHKLMISRTIELFVK